jgi:hypothetical protein
MELSNEKAQISKPEILKLKEINLTKKANNTFEPEMKITSGKSDKNIDEII